MNVTIVAVAGSQFGITSAETTHLASLGPLPIVLETPAQPVWTTWNAEWRDLLIVDPQGNFFGKQNLTSFDPNPSANGGRDHDSLKDMFVAASRVGSDVRVELGQAVYRVGGGESRAVVTLTRAGDPSVPVSVTVATADGTAQSPGDFTAIRSTVTLGPGQTSQTVEIPIAAYGAREEPATFTVSLSSPSGGAQLGSPSQAVVSIVPDSFYQDYVTATYQALFHRTPDPAGMAYWRGQLESGAPPGAIAAQLTWSAEYFQTNVIKPVYQEILGREADAGGLAYWTDRMLAGATDEQIGNGFLASEEFYRQVSGSDVAVPVNAGHDGLWVAALYQTLLGRSADPAGKDYWVALLGQGHSRQDVTNAISATPEGLGTRVRETYRRYLGRGAGDAEVAYWVDRYRAGARNEDIVAGFLGSEEFIGRGTGH